MIRQATEEFDLSDHALRPGQRVECYGGNVFGTVVKLLRGGPRNQANPAKLQPGDSVRVKLDSGETVDLRNGKVWYAPSLATIRQLTSQIQREWSASRFAAYDPEPASVPVIHDGWGATLAEFGRVD